MKTKHRMQWIDGQHYVVMETPDGSLTVPYDDFIRIADSVITGIIEPSNPAYKKSFTKLNALATAANHRGGKA
ncbi:hypothetical protein [Mesorhizobium sp.]|uniref:hypothetical protein n=1 Tax=Mesorhizobium sp. TaxID=1871066 RepID=UPI000FE7FCB7|nr:hypothetical protein [Mesorhizobium sp.]RWP05107.1 MAG: hypothetical protein EOQ99_16690 [Mesorhizobium sp.]